jgi:hypothetical protein
MRSAKKATPLPYVVIRTFSAGVHVGELASRRGKEVDLINAKRIWNWRGRNTLHEIALYGVADGSRVSEAVSEITLTEAIEVITCTASARANLQGAKWPAA